MVEELKTGTTIIGLVFKDGVVLGADSKASLAHLAYDEETKKLFKVTDELGVAVAGSVGDAQMIVRFLRSQAKLFEVERETKMTPQAASTFLANVLNANRYFPFFSQFILGGVNKEPIVYDLDPTGGLLERKKYTVGGSGTELALSVLDQIYKPSLEESQAKKIAVRAIEAAKRRDNFSGGIAVNLMVITKQGMKETRIEDSKKFLKE